MLSNEKKIDFFGVLDFVENFGFLIRFRLILVVLDRFGAFLDATKKPFHKP